VHNSVVLLILKYLCLIATVLVPPEEKLNVSHDTIVKGHL